MTNKSQKSAPKYRGFRRKEDVIRLSEHGKIRNVIGTLFKVVRNSDPNAEKAFTRKKIFQSSCYKPSPHDFSVLAYGEEKSKYRIIGRFKENDNPQLVKKTRQTGKKKSFDFDEQLQRITALKKTGQDPKVRMSFICMYVGESAQTIYRKIKLGKFPAPTKQDRSSFWKLSEVEDYYNS